MSTIITVITAFASGAFGSALGAVPAVIMTAVVALAGIAANIAGAEFNLVNDIAFGMFLGPHVSFGPACCAAAYAWKKGYLENSKDITTPLVSLKRPDVLMVGGIFAVIGWYLNLGIAAVANGGIDTIALTVVVISVAAKTIYGGSPIGKVEGGKSRFGVDSPCWLPYMTSATGYQLLTIGAIVGVISGYIVVAMCNLAAATGNAAIAGVATLPVWAVAIICFFVNVSGLPIPVYHHIGLCAAYGAKMAYDAGVGESAVLWGIAFGILGAYAADWLAKVFCTNGEGFVDPPSAAIAFVSVLPLAILPAAGLTANYVVPAVIILLLAVYAVMCEAQVKKIK